MNKICYFNLATYSQTGGIENFNKTFLKALNVLDNITSISVYDVENKSDTKNIEYKNFNKKKITASLYLLKNIYKIEKLFVAHLNLLPIVIVSKILNPKIEVYLSIYGIEVWKKLPLVYRFFLSKIRILSISTYTTQQFKKFNLLNGDNIFYLPPAIDIKVANNFSNVYNDYEFNILSVTRLDSSDNYKGVDTILKTLPLLVKKIPNLKYTIIGKGNDQGRLKKLAKDLQVDSYVEFKGFVEYIEPYYHYCDIFALPSKGEGFGIVYIEAMKYKKPCIASDEGGQTDVVIDNKTGFLCKYDNTQCLEKKIFELYRNKNLKKEFGESGYKHLINNFTFDKFTERLKEILND